MLRTLGACCRTAIGGGRKVGTLLPALTTAAAAEFDDEDVEDDDNAPDPVDEPAIRPPASTMEAIESSRMARFRSAAVGLTMTDGAAAGWDDCE